MGREGWRGVRILTSCGLWLDIIFVYLWTKTKRALKAKYDNELIYDELEQAIRSATEEGRGIILIGEFNARLGQLVGDDKSDTEGDVLMEWFTRNNLSLMNGKGTFKNYITQKG